MLVVASSKRQQGVNQLVAVLLKSCLDRGGRLVERALAPAAGFLAIRQVYFNLFWTLVRPGLPRSGSRTLSTTLPLRAGSLAVTLPQPMPHYL